MDVAYRIESMPLPEEFTPHKVTFFIETPEQHAWFHDNVATKIGVAGQHFIGQCYGMGTDGHVVNTSGLIKPKSKTT